MKQLKKTDFMREAAEGRGHIWPLEVMLCLVVFFVASMLMSVAQVPAMMAWLFSNDSYMAMISSGNPDIEKIMEMMRNLPEWVTIYSLYTEIVLVLLFLIYARFVDKRKARTLGFVKKGLVPQYLKGLVAGSVVFGIAYLICILTGSIKAEGIADNVIPAYIIFYFGGYIIQGIAEEVICRGYLFVSLTRKYTVGFSAIVSALFFALLHSMNAGLTSLSMFNLFLFGLFAALLFLLTENIWMVAAFHSVWNFVQGNVLGIQVSGMSHQNAIISSTVVSGREWINGGVFGMEGGLAVTFVLCVAIGITMALLKKKGSLIDEVEVTETVQYRENAPVMSEPVIEEPKMEQKGTDLYQSVPVNIDSIQASQSVTQPTAQTNGQEITSDQKSVSEQAVSGVTKTAFDAEYFSESKE